MKCVLKSPGDTMISKTDRSDEAKIFKNTYVFTVRLHLRNVDNARTKLTRTFFFRSEIDIYQKACLSTLWVSIWDAFGKPKSLANRVWGGIGIRTSMFTLAGASGKWTVSCSRVSSTPHLPSCSPVATHLLGLGLTILYIMEYRKN